MAGSHRVGALRGAELAGIHIYSGGQIQSADKLAGTFEYAIHLAEQIAQAGVPLRLLDLGGGFPWPFGTSDAPVDISALREKLQRVNAQRRLTADAELWFESGRYLVASCGTLLSTVLDVKVALGGKTHIILDTGMIHLGGMAGLGRIYRAVASIEPLAGPNGETLQSVDVMGPTDYALDYVTRDDVGSAFESGRHCSHTQRRRLWSYRQSGRLCRLATPCGGVLPRDLGRCGASPAHGARAYSDLTC